jgi:hypothetical protein
MNSIRKAALMATMLVLVVGVAGAANIQGTYLEARDAEIYASHCYANSEMNLRGELAVMGWKIEHGAVNNVSLDGLGVVAVVRASATLGDPFNSPYPAKAVLIVDERATPEQRAALESFVKNAAGRLVETIVRTDVAPINLTFDGSIHESRATLTAGNLVKIKTRPIHASDSLCHLDDVYYGPLVQLDHAMAAFSTQTMFHGKGLDTRFDGANRSNAYLGTFSMDAGAVTTD